MSKTARVNRTHNFCKHNKCHWRILQIFTIHLKSFVPGKKCFCCIEYSVQRMKGIITYMMKMLLVSDWPVIFDVMLGAITGKPWFHLRSCFLRQSIDITFFYMFTNHFSLYYHLRQVILRTWNAFFYSSNTIFYFYLRKPVCWYSKRKYQRNQF